ncbi:DoxX family protein [Sporocytophaga myxococcoides]|uniref:DoxX family protein n=1 Tax=Sporocytophaga myxococcoides TaxID=153721 RepID=UPI00048AF40D|nr:DoxX family membrane protein [Sporocytophaga myxococcoides]
MNTTAYLLLRLAVGASMFGHGLVRFPKLSAFSNWMVTGFEKSMLPQALVVPFSYALPFMEFVIGFLLIVGLFTEVALISGAGIMILLIFGTSLIENWEAIPSQLIHVMIFVWLLQFKGGNGISVDQVLLKR